MKSNNYLISIGYSTKHSTKVVNNIITSPQSAPSIAPNDMVGRKIPPVTPAVLETIIITARIKKTRTRKLQTIRVSKSFSVNECPVPRVSAMNNPIEDTQANIKGNNILTEIFLIKVWIRLFIN